MRTKTTLLIGRLLLAGSVIAMLASPTFAAKKPARIGAPAPSFTLKDQFDHDTRLEDFKGNLVLIVCGDRLGGDYMNDWAKGVSENYKDAPSAVTIVRVADLAAVPPFFHAFVKHKFLTKNAEGLTAKPTLLDWDALVPELFGFTENLTNVYVIDTGGTLRYKASGKGTPDDLRNVIRALDELRQQTTSSSIHEGTKQ